MFGADTRGQAIQIGAIVLFSFVVLTFSLYQATVVPDQNREVEFNHNQEVQKDMINVRSAVVAASFPGNNGVASVTLGTNYPARVIAVNPGPAAGSLRTQLDSEIRIDSESKFTTSDENVCGTDAADDVARTFVYEPNYNEFDAPRTVYESSVVYNQDMRGGEAVLTGQALYYDTGGNDGTINLIALQNEFQRSSSGRISVEFIHGETKRTAGVTDPSITLPTMVSDVETWEQGILGTLPNSRIDSVSLDDANDKVTIQFSGTFDILCTPVGIGGAPPSGAASLSAPGGGSGGGSGGSTSADAVSTVSGSAEAGGGGQELKFDITASEEVTGTGFAIETKKDLAGITNIDKNPSFRIKGVRQDGKDDGRPEYVTDGTEYTFNDKQAVITSGETGEVKLKQFDSPKIRVNGFASDRSSADIIITLIFDDSSRKEFYIDAEPK